MRVCWGLAAHHCPKHSAGCTRGREPTDSNTEKLLPVWLLTHEYKTPGRDVRSPSSPPAAACPCRARDAPGVGGRREYARTWCEKVLEEPDGGFGSRAAGSPWMWWRDHRVSHAHAESLLCSDRVLRWLCSCLPCLGSEWPCLRSVSYRCCVFHGCCGPGCGGAPPAWGRGLCLLPCAGWVAQGSCMSCSLVFPWPLCPSGPSRETEPTGGVWTRASRSRPVMGIG